MSVAPEVRTIGVVLVDDHAIVREGLRSVLEREPDVAVLAEAASASAALDVVTRLRPDVVVLDLKLSVAVDTEGLELCAELTRECPDVATVVLTSFVDEQLVQRAARAGARGYVVKDVDTAALLRAVREVAGGGSAFPDPVSPPAVEVHPLTDREAEVLQLLAHGLSNKDIGARLYISETTAKFHVGNILRKLGAARRAEAVYEASKLGWV